MASLQPLTADVARKGAAWGPAPATGEAADALHRARGVQDGLLQGLDGCLHFCFLRQSQNKWSTESIAVLATIWRGSEWLRGEHKLTGEGFFERRGGGGCVIFLLRVREIMRPAGEDVQREVLLWTHSQVATNDASVGGCCLRKACPVDGRSPNHSYPYRVLSFLLTSKR